MTFPLWTLALVSFAHDPSQRIEQGPRGTRSIVLEQQTGAGDCWPHNGQVGTLHVVSFFFQDIRFLTWGPLGPVHVSDHLTDSIPAQLSTDSLGNWYAMAGGSVLRNWKDLLLSDVLAIDVDCDDSLYFLQQAQPSGADLYKYNPAGPYRLLAHLPDRGLGAFKELEIDSQGGWYVLREAGIVRNGSLLPAPGIARAIALACDDTFYCAVDRGDTGTDLYKLGTHGLRSVDHIADEEAVSDLAADTGGNWWAIAASALIVNGTPMPSLFPTLTLSFSPGLQPPEAWEQMFPSPQPGLAQEFEDAASPMNCTGLVELDDLVPELRAAEAGFYQDIISESPSATYTVTAAYRPTAYQAHLYEIREAFKLLRNQPGVSSDIVDGRPTLILTGEPACVRLVEQVNEEIVRHCLAPGTQHHLPDVQKPCESLHEQGLAVDISIIDGPPNHRIEQLATGRGMHRPCGGRDRLVHYQLTQDQHCSR